MRNVKTKGAASWNTQDDLFRILFDEMPRPMLITNEKVEIEYVNNAWQRQFGYTHAEVRGKNPRILQSGKTPRDVYQKMWKTLSAGRTFRSDKVIDKRKDGSFFQLYTTTFPMQSGSKRYFVQILDDITESKRVEEFRKHFIRIAAHDIRNPLQSLRLLGELAAVPGQELDVNMLRFEIDRMDALVKALLDISQFENGKLKLRLQETDIAELIQKASLAKRPYPGTLRVNITSNAIVLADPDRILQILHNLIDNAMKYSQTQSPVEVLLKTTKTRVLVSVSDKGRGIPKAEQAMLFDPFFRTKGAKDSRIAGTGLGLYIVREIMKAHKGRIWVRSRAGKGSTFVFSLPKKRRI